jgi:hypothetical protein
VVHPYLSYLRIFQAFLVQAIRIPQGDPKAIPCVRTELQSSFSALGELEDFDQAGIIPSASWAGSKPSHLCHLAKCDGNGLGLVLFGLALPPCLSVLMDDPGGVVMLTTVLIS